MPCVLPAMLANDSRRNASIGVARNRTPRPTAPATNVSDIPPSVNEIGAATDRVERDRDRRQAARGRSASPRTRRASHRPRARSASRSRHRADSDGAPVSSTWRRFVPNAAPIENRLGFWRDGRRRRPARCIIGTFVGAGRHRLERQLDLDLVARRDAQRLLGVLATLRVRDELVLAGRHDQRHVERGRASSPSRISVAPSRARP